MKIIKEHRDNGVVDGINYEDVFILDNGEKFYVYSNKRAIDKAEFPAVTRMKKVTRELLKRGVKQENIDKFIEQLPDVSPVKKREGTKLIKEFPENEKAVGIVKFNNTIYVATERRVYMMIEDKLIPIEIVEV